MKIFMNTDQAAEAIGMSVRQFRRLYMAGRIEALNFKPNRGKAGKSGRFLFRTEDVLRLKRERDLVLVKVLTEAVLEMELD